MKQLLITLTLFTWHVSLPAMEKPGDTLKMFKWLTVAGAAQAVSQDISDTPLCKKFAKKTGIEIGDIASTTTLASTLMAFSYILVQPKHRTSLQEFAIRFPFATLVAKLATCKWAKQTAQTIPLLDWYMGCSNDECTGLCSSCSLKSFCIYSGIMRLLM